MSSQLTTKTQPRNSPPSSAATFGTASCSTDKFQSVIHKFATSQALPEDLRNKCMAAVIENEVASMKPQMLTNASPARIELFDHIKQIRNLDNVSENTKDDLVKHLSSNYVQSKRGDSSSCASKPGLPKTLFPNAAGIKSDSRNGFQSVVPASASCTTATGVPAFHWADGLKMPPPRVDPVWTKSVPYLSFPSALGAIISIDPCMKIIKTYSPKNCYIREYQCSIRDCQARARIVCCNQDPYCPEAQLFHLNEHRGHHLRGWQGHYDDMCDHTKKTSKKGLPRHFRDIVDFIAKDNGLQPVQIWRKLSTEVGVIGDFLLSNNRLVYSKIREQVFQRVKHVRSQNKGSTVLTFMSNLIGFKCQHKLRLPDDFHAQPILAEDHLLSLARCLESSGHLNGVKCQGNTTSLPHRDMVILDYPDLGPTLSPRYNVLMSGRKDAPKEEMVVFTSLSLLATICHGQALDWQICLSADGTHNIAANDYKLIVIGVINITQHGSKRLHPLAYAWCPSETELCVLVALHHIKTAIYELFRIEPQFRGGMLSDRSEVYVNSFKWVFPGNPVMQCYAHIIRKFIIDGKRAHNGSYRFHVVGDQRWLQRIAKHDVSNLRLCRTPAMWEKGIELVRQGWLDDKQNKVYETFARSYLEDDDYNVWRYGASGIPGCVPQNQSNERITLELKGCSQFDGAIKTGRSFQVMMTVEFPKLISINSHERVGLSRPIPMLKKDFVTHKESVLQFFAMIDINIDTAMYRNGYLVNDWSYVGKPIDAVRIKQYEMSLDGRFELSFNERREFFGRVNGLCFVESRNTTVTNEPETVFCHGSCFDYFDECWCVHAAIIQYGKDLETLGRKIPTRKASSIRRDRKGQLWRELQCHAIEKRKKGRLERLPQPLDEEAGNGVCPGIVVTQTQDDNDDI